MKIRPMLAASFEDPQNIEAELTFLTYPLLASPKIDGIRWMKPPSEPTMSRSWTPLPNLRFQKFMDHPVMSYLDGEVIVGTDPTAPGIFNQSQSAIMTRDDDRPFSIWVFDHWGETAAPFEMRTKTAESVVNFITSLDSECPVFYVKHSLLNSPEEVLTYEEEALKAGYEGIMLRGPNMPYKFGRSTLKQQGLIKVKRFSDDEATVIGFEALERNTNEQTRNSFGLAKRSSHREGKIADSLMGKLLVCNERFGEFAIGSGFDVQTRSDVWSNQQAYLGKTVTFKFQAHGTKDKPRMPIWKGFRKD